MELEGKEDTLLKIEEIDNKYYFINDVKDCIPKIFGYLSLGVTLYQIIRLLD